jgi:hypothetical protein
MFSTKCRFSMRKSGKLSLILAPCRVAKTRTAPRRYPENSTMRKSGSVAFLGNFPTQPSQIKAKFSRSLAPTLPKNEGIGAPPNYEKIGGKYEKTGEK